MPRTEEPQEIEQALELSGVIPEAPLMSKLLGDRTPAFAEWLVKYNPPREMIDAAILKPRLEDVK